MPASPPHPAPWPAPPPTSDLPQTALARASSFPRRSIPWRARTTAMLRSVSEQARLPDVLASRRAPPSCCRALHPAGQTTPYLLTSTASARLLPPGLGSVRRGHALWLGSPRFPPTAPGRIA